MALNVVNTYARQLAARPEHDYSHAFHVPGAAYKVPPVSVSVVFYSEMTAWLDARDASEAVQEALSQGAKP